MLLFLLSATSTFRTLSNSDYFPTITSLLNLVAIELLCLGRHDIPGNEAAPASSIAEYWTCLLSKTQGELLAHRY